MLQDMENLSIAYRLETPRVCNATKSGSVKDCNNYRTSALISHASKILLIIIFKQAKAKSRRRAIQLSVRLQEKQGNNIHAVCTPNIDRQD